jgi:hypothetical protein
MVLVGLLVCGLALAGLVPMAGIWLGALAFFGALTITLIRAAADHVNKFGDLSHYDAQLVAGFWLFALVLGSELAAESPDCAVITPICWAVGIGYLLMVLWAWKRKASARRAAEQALPANV